MISNATEMGIRKIDVELAWEDWRDAFEECTVEQIVEAIISFNKECDEA